MNRSNEEQISPAMFRASRSWWWAIVPIIFFVNAVTNVVLLLGANEKMVVAPDIDLPKTDGIRTTHHHHPSEQYLQFPQGVHVPGLAAIGANNHNSSTTTTTLSIKSLEEFHKRAGYASIYPHQIPHRTIFIHTRYENPEDMEPLIYNNIQNTHRIFAEFWNETKHIAPLWFLRDQDCLMAVNLVEPQLVPHYLNEARGNNKANLCRVAALYLKGGYYFDVDMGTIQAVPLTDDITFATPEEYKEPQRGRDRNRGVQGLFNSFLAAAPGHPILRRNIDVFLDHYNGADLPLRSKDNHMGTGTLRLAFDATPEDQKRTASIELAESLLRGSKELDYPHLEKQDGSGCCCDFFVENPQRKEVYFWSRIPGGGENCALKYQKRAKYQKKSHNGF